MRSLWERGVGASPKSGSTCRCLHAPLDWEGVLVRPAPSSLLSLRECAPRTRLNTRGHLPASFDQRASLLSLRDPTRGWLQSLEAPPGTYRLRPLCFPLPWSSEAPPLAGTSSPQEESSLFLRFLTPFTQALNFRGIWASLKGAVNSKSTALPAKTLTYLFKNFRPIDLPVSLKVRSYKCGCLFKTTLEQIMSKTAGGNACWNVAGLCLRQTSNHVRPGVNFGEKTSSSVVCSHKCKFSPVLLIERAGSE